MSWTPSKALLFISFHTTQKIVSGIKSICFQPLMRFHAQISSLTEPAITYVHPTAHQPQSIACTKQHSNTCLQVSSSFLKRKLVNQNLSPLLQVVYGQETFLTSLPSEKRDPGGILIFQICLTGKCIPASLYLYNFLQKDLTKRDSLCVRPQPKAMPKDPVSPQKLRRKVSSLSTEIEA